MSIEARPGDEPAHDNMSIEDAAGPLWKRLAWFVGLWVGGVATVTAVAYGIRIWIT